MSSDRVITNFYDALYDVHSKCYRCYQTLGKSTTDTDYVRERISAVAEKSTNSKINNLASSLLTDCKTCDKTNPLVARRLTRGETI